MSEHQSSFKKIGQVVYVKEEEVIVSEEKKKIVVYLEKERNIFEKPTFRMTAFIDESAPVDVQQAIEQAFKEWCKGSSHFHLLEKIVEAVEKHLPLPINYRVKILNQTEEGELSLSVVLEVW